MEQSWICEMPMHSVCTPLSDIFAHTFATHRESVCAQQTTTWMRTRFQFSFFLAFSARPTKKKITLYSSWFLSLRGKRDMTIYLRLADSLHTKHTYQFSFLYNFIIFFGNTIGSLVWLFIFVDCGRQTVAPINWRHKIKWYCELYRLYLFCFRRCRAYSRRQHFCQRSLDYAISTPHVKVYVCARVCDIFGTKCSIRVEWRVVEKSFGQKIEKKMLQSNELIYHFPFSNLISALGFHHWFSLHHRCDNSGRSRRNVEKCGIEQNGSHRGSA